MKTNIFIVAFLLCATSSFAQLVRNNKIIQVVPKNAVSFNASGGVLYINNDSGSKMRNNYKPGNGTSFGVDYKRQFIKVVTTENSREQVPYLVGMGAGLGVSYLYQTSFMWNHSETLDNFTDTDGNVSNVTLSYNNIKEKLKLTYLDIPLYLTIGTPSQTKICAYGNVGLKASILVANKFTGEGTYTARSDKPVNQADRLEYYGTNKKSYSKKPEFDPSSFVLWGTLAGGVNFPLSNVVENSIPSKFILQVGAKIDYTLSKVSKSLSDPYFKDAKYRINQSNIFGKDGSRIFVPGVEVKLIYCINSIVE